MRVLTVYAHHDPLSFCPAVPEQFTCGLDDAGHENEVVDLAHESVPLDVWDVWSCSRSSALRLGTCARPRSGVGDS